MCNDGVWTQVAVLAVVVFYTAGMMVFLAWDVREHLEWSSQMRRILDRRAQVGAQKEEGQHEHGDH